MLTDFSAAIFDMDGLLLDSEPLAKQAFDTVCEQYGLGDLSDLFLLLIGTNKEKGNAIIEQGIDSSINADEFNHAWRGLYGEWVQDKAVPLKAGVAEVLAYCLQHHIPMAVATSSQTAIATHKLEKAGILHYFDTVIGGDQISHSKPHPEIFLNAAAALSCPAVRCVAFEDSPNGVKSAVAAGMTVVQVPDLLEPDDDLLSLGHSVYDRISDAINLACNK